MKKYLLIFVVAGALICLRYNTHVVAEQQDMNVQGGTGEQKMDIDTEEVIRKAKDLAKKHMITKEEALAEQNLESQEVKGNSHIIRIFNSKKGIKKEYIFTNDNIKDLRYRDSEQNGFDIFYYANGMVGSFIEYKNGKLHGIFAKFYKNGTLQYIAHCQDGKFVGVAQRWDEFGKLVESVEFQQPQDFEIDKRVPQ